MRKWPILHVNSGNIEAYAAVRNVELSDKWTIGHGRIVISGTQAIARVLLDQKLIDRAAGLTTAGYITGYRGSPLGTLDSVLWSLGDRLKSLDIVFQPGVNEDIAATAVRGTQQLDALPSPKFDGVFSAWYGKGPGVDRSGDAFKHGNYAGVHSHGGVVLFYGDDHAAKSSTIAHHSEQAVAASLIPSLYPSSVYEIWLYGLLAYALSRYSGSWVGLKCVTDVVEQTATVDIHANGFSCVEPSLSERHRTLQGLHAYQGKFDPLREEQIVVEERLPLVKAFVRANQIDRTVISASEGQIGIVTAGKTYGDVRSALTILGLNEEKCRASGISLYKVGCIWPLEATGIREFAGGQSLLFVIEEKGAFLEPQIAATFINDSKRPIVIGKHDQGGHALLSSVLPLEPLEIARVLRRVLLGYGIEVDDAALQDRAPTPEAVVPAEKRSPYFCSGCPHNRSTRIPEGSVSLTGIGCHTMVNFTRPKEALLPTQMGGEGGNWIGLAPFSGTKHVFQNMGDGTYFHSGLLAIRAAVAAKVNITYKILYNDAVAMTGGQPIDGPISVARIAQQVRHEGVQKIIVLSDDPRSHVGNPGFPDNVVIDHRDNLDAHQRLLRETAGCSVLIYEQTCAAEKRRRRKRGQMTDPPKRLFIAKSVCEGCGNCSDVSTCVSIIPVDTEFGRKRAIDQSSCNKDYSCLGGFCPSFVTIYDAAPRKPSHKRLNDISTKDLATPVPAPLGDESFNIMIAGIGGTGVVTVGAIIGMAAHIDGMSMSVFDMTGVAQKNGAVFSHLKIARQADVLTSARLAEGDADTILALDLVAAVMPESLRSTAATRTRAVANMVVTPTVDLQFDRDFKNDPVSLLGELRRRTARNHVIEVDATTIAEQLMGDTIAGNMIMVGVAAQSGLLPVTIPSLEQAIRLNAVSVALNLSALRVGRLLVSDPPAAKSLLQGVDAAEATTEPTLDEVIARRIEHLNAYQGPGLVEKYVKFISTIRESERSLGLEDERLTRTVAKMYAKLLSYKDEYEVARLLSGAEFQAELESAFESGGRIFFNLAPPTLTTGATPRKREFSGRILPLLRILAKCRFLRGTRLDLFGYSSERRSERALICEYEELVSQVLRVLDVRNFERAVDLLSLVDSIRGYGHIKRAAIERYGRAVNVLLKSLMSEPNATTVPPLVSDNPGIPEPLGNQSA